MPVTRNQALQLRPTARLQGADLPAAPGGAQAAARAAVNAAVHYHPLST